MELERRYCELRHEGEGRRLTGTAVRYGDVARLPFGRERFEARAFGDVSAADVMLNAQHDRRTPLARTGDGGLTLEDDGERLTIRADLPETRAADDILELVRKRVLRGLSVEFRAVHERMDGGVRVIERARLVAVSVVDSPAYPASEVEAREAAAGIPRRRLWL